NPWWSDSATAAVASDLGREVVAIALDLAPGHADAHCIQGMLYSAAGELEPAAQAFEWALAMDEGLAIAHGFAGYNAAFLGSADHGEAASAAASLRQQYPYCPASAFEQLWLSRSPSATYRAQIFPLFERIRELGVAV